MENMFAFCYELEDVNLSGWDTFNVINMRGMFSSDKRLTELDLTSFDTSNVKNMEYMFGTCQELKTIKLGDRWNTRNVENTERMFHICQLLTNIDFSNFYLRNNQQFKNGIDFRKTKMFSECPNAIKKQFKKQAKF